MTPQEQYEEDLKHPSTIAFLQLLRGGIAAEGNSREELEEISSRLAIEPEYKGEYHAEGR